MHTLAGSRAWLLQESGRRYERMSSRPLLQYDPALVMAGVWDVNHETSAIVE